MPRPLLVVFAGPPGTGKTTLAARLSSALRATYLRVDVVETVLTSQRWPIGPAGYAVVHEMAVSNLLLGRDVVVDAVNPVPEARAGWRQAAERGGADLVVLETVLPDRDEHRRRVEGRTADIPGHVVPTWADVEDGEWVPWNVARDGERVVIDTTDAGSAWRELSAAIATCGRAVPPPPSGDE